MVKLSVHVLLMLFSLYASAQNSVFDKFALTDSCITILRKMDLKGWSLHKTGNRITLTKTDSVLIAPSYSDYKPGLINSFIRHKYQLYIDLVERPMDFTEHTAKTINDSIDKLIRSYKKRTYKKGEYFSSYEAIELLEKMKIKPNIRLQQTDLRFSDNCAAEWIPFEINDLKYPPYEPPSGLMKKLEELKKKIADRLKDEGI